ncbi:hypothetical protein PsSCT_30250 [Pseudomonas sp. SCT]
MHFRRAAGEIESLHGMSVDHLAQQRQILIAHRLLSSWACIDMAMKATLVAAVGKIHLQSLQITTPDRWKAQGIKQRKSGMHCGCPAPEL